MVRFIDDPTPDGAPLSDWIYSLYANEDQRTERLAALIQELQTRVSEKDKAVNTLTAELDEKQRIIEAQSAEIAEIRRSRSWRIAQFVQRLRLWIAPYGSWQERLMGLKSPPNQHR